jgi:hypothetical protein
MMSVILIIAKTGLEENGFIVDEFTEPSKALASSNQNYMIYF